MENLGAARLLRACTVAIPRIQGTRLRRFAGLRMASKIDL